ncbi:phosphate acyltransferase PlsX [Brevibacillus sp. B_LB10_24]|uniref:phosphate acyltransferase PlsX n=1 Tax=Brevibacillus sp. B_LB10_24 TaxID=3380645 RepID=UPI0038B8344F
MRIALDAMGGDNAPRSTVEGAVQACLADPALKIVLVGDEAQVKPHLPEQLPPGIELLHCSEVIEPDDEPVKAVRRKKDASMVVAVGLARDEKVDAVISAGNTGALMTAGLLVAGRMQGIERPALAALFPNMKSKATLVLDVGANMDAKPLHLLQYAIMGSLYAEKVLGYDRPTVALLNVGTEEAKGNELTKAVYPLLAASNVNFIGNVEARDVLDGMCDVLVCDGFSGNVMLKSMEGAISTIFSQLKKEFLSSFVNKIAAAILKPSLTRFKTRMDYSEYGGAPLLGLRRPVVKAHGSSNAHAIKNAILVASRFAQLDVNGYVQKEMDAGRESERE